MFDRLGIFERQRIIRINRARYQRYAAQACAFGGDLFQNMFVRPLSTTVSQKVIKRD